MVALGTERWVQPVECWMRGRDVMGVLKWVRDRRRGQWGWAMVEEDEGAYDYVQEMARSGYGDMLFDRQRNDAYEAGLKATIAEKLAQGGRADVLDIGTGTGLLSMMALRAGASSATAVEAFGPMASVAQRTARLNRRPLTVHHSRSTDLPDLPSPRPNVCVAEVFDTELIGEGALRTFRDALERLLAPGARVVPASATVSVLPVSSDWLRRWDRFPQTLSLGKGQPQLSVPSPYRDCPGQVSVHDLQLDEIPQSHFQRLAAPTVAFKFNFERAEDIKFDEEWRGTLTAEATGRLDALLFWWDLDMDGSGGALISTKPSFLLPKGETQPWRDHWLGAVYYLPQPLHLTAGDAFQLSGTHDEYSFWFSAAKGAEEAPPQPRPHCSCGLHVSLSRRHMAWAGDTERYETLLRCLGPTLDALPSGSRVACLGDGSLLPAALAHAKPGLSFVSVQPETRVAAFLRSVAEANSLTNLSVVGSAAEAGAGLSLVVVDPQFLGSLLPWHNLQAWSLAKELREASPEAAVWPREARVRCAPLRLRDLWKIRAEVGTVSGFDLSPFDEIQQRAIAETDEAVEAQPLWEYPSVLLGPPETLLSWAADSSAPGGSLVLRLGQGANGVAFWLEWLLGRGAEADEWLSQGLLGRPAVGQAPEWEPTSSQGVFLLPPAFLNAPKLHISAAPLNESGDLEFNFLPQ